MKTNLLTLLTFVLTAINLAFVRVYADVAPDPVTRKPSLLVIVLVIVVVLATIALLVKLFKKN